MSVTIETVCEGCSYTIPFLVGVVLGILIGIWLANKIKMSNSGEKQ